MPTPLASFLGAGGRSIIYRRLLIVRARDDSLALTRFFNDSVRAKLATTCTHI